MTSAFTHKKNKMNAKEISRAASLVARKGGIATLKKHGKKHYKKMAQKRWNKSSTQASKK